MERKFNFSEGEYYHVYNRGVEKRDIFLDDNDRKRFQRMLFIANGTKPVVYKTIQGLPLEEIERGKEVTAIGAYCLMPNHFHLLLKETKRGGISKFLAKLTTGYSMYFNTRHEHKGTLFQGVFQAKHIDDDAYLKYVFSYIHLNPIKLIEPGWKEGGIRNRKKAEEYLAKFPYSSYTDNIGKNRIEKAILDPEEFPEYFKTPRDFHTEITDWLAYQEE